MKTITKKDYLLHSLPDSKDIAYAALLTNRQQARELLLANIRKVRKSILPIVMDQLLDEPFVVFLKREGLVPTLPASCCDKTVAYLHGQQESVTAAYINYDLRDSHIEGGRPHWRILLVLAELLNINLKIWHADKVGALTLCELDEKLSMKSAAHKPRIDLLLIGRRRYHLVEFMNDQLLEHHLAVKCVGESV